jgi:hypothetical protein
LNRILSWEVNHEAATLVEKMATEHFAVDEAA